MARSVIGEREEKKVNISPSHRVIFSKKKGRSVRWAIFFPGGSGGSWFLTTCIILPVLCYIDISTIYSLILLIVSCCSRREFRIAFYFFRLPLFIFYLWGHLWSPEEPVSEEHLYVVLTSSPIPAILLVHWLPKDLSYRFAASYFSSVGSPYLSLTTGVSEKGKIYVPFA